MIEGHNNFSLNELVGEAFDFPKCLLRTQKFVSIDYQGAVFMGTRVHPAIGYIHGGFHTEKLENKKKEFQRAIAEIDKEISKLIDTKVLRGREQKGYMAYSLVNHRLYEGSIAIDEATYKKLCATDSRWQNTREVYCIRYPNLGPKTTSVFRLCIFCNNDENIIKSDVFGSLRGLLEDYGLKEFVPRYGGIYFNPNDLKNCLEGDADGDLVYIVPYNKGNPNFITAGYSVNPSEINQEDIDLLIKKSKPGQRSIGVKDYLSKHLDVNLIGLVTYGAKLSLYVNSAKYANSKNPMHEGWLKDTAQTAIKETEFAMDIRKGDFTESQINTFKKKIAQYGLRINELKKRGNWFAKTVTNNGIEDIDQFICEFPVLQDYYDYITRKNLGNSNVEKS